MDHEPRIASRSRRRHLAGRPRQPVRAGALSPEGVQGEERPAAAVHHLFPGSLRRESRSAEGLRREGLRRLGAGPDRRADELAFRHRRLQRRHRKRSSRRPCGTRTRRRSSARRASGSTRARPTTFQFHQVSVWALLQCALAFFEDGTALGRTIPWAFEGNRLIVVPHAGFGENAFYDRASKSLQFYYFGRTQTPPSTPACPPTSSITSSRTRVLDGIRPLFNESSHPQTAAFHEFMGDLTAILLTLKNGTLRRQLAEVGRAASSRRPRRCRRWPRNSARR